MKTENYNNELSLWIDKEKTTAELTNVVSRLILEHATELVMFRNRMTHITKSEILNLHDYAAKFVKQDISVHQTLPLAKAILELGIKNAKIDLGKLAYEWNKEGSQTIKLMTSLRINCQHSLRMKITSTKRCYSLWFWSYW